jgi:hypothetical protein
MQDLSLGREDPAHPAHLLLPAIEGANSRADVQQFLAGVDDLAPHFLDVGRGGLLDTPFVDLVHQLGACDLAYARALIDPPASPVSEHCVSWPCRTQQALHTLSVGTEASLQLCRGLVGDLLSFLLVPDQPTVVSLSTVGAW